MSMALVTQHFMTPDKVDEVDTMLAIEGDAVLAIEGDV